MKETLASEFPEIAKMWDKTRNNCTPDEKTPFSTYKAYWLCPKGHVFQATIRSLTKLHHECPYCHGRNLKDIRRDIESGKESAIKEYPINLFTPSLCVKAVMSNQKLLDKLPQEVINTHRFVKELMKSDPNRVSEYSYDQALGQFVFSSTTKAPCKTSVQAYFNRFRDFYLFMDGQIDGLDLTHYDFSRFDFTKYDMRKVKMPGRYQKQIGCYDDSLRQSLLHIFSSTPPEEYQGVLAPSETHIISLPSGSEKYGAYNYITVAYISDLHLDSHIAKEFENKPFNHSDLELYYDSVIDAIIPDTSESMYDFLLIAGDVADNIEIAMGFYQQLVKRNPYIKIIAVLGNHELRGLKFDLRTGSTEIHALPLDQTQQLYKQFFRANGIYYLENNVFFFADTPGSLFPSLCVVDPAKLDRLPAWALTHSYFFLFGGTGFSGLNKSFNASHGLYLNNLTQEEDIQLSDKFKKKYDQFATFMETHHTNIPTIIMTHNPPRDWKPKSEPLKPFTYIYGHTHDNHYESTEEGLQIYADNQVGYYGKYVSKFFYLNGTYDIFTNVPDGIHEITPDQYFDFYRGMNLYAGRGKVAKYNAVLMVKRCGYYIFFTRSPNGKKLNILDAGAVKAAPSSNLNYYYENLPFFAMLLLSSTDILQSHLKKIAAAVKSFGGDGNVHGCIVDIDFYNHIYLNPMTQKIYFYYAQDTGSRIFYKNLPSLLEESCPELYEAYKAIERTSPGKNKVSKHKLAEFQNTILSFNTPDDTLGFNCDPGFYQASILMRKFQGLRTKKILRVWNEELLAQCKNDFPDIDAQTLDTHLKQLPSHEK